MRLLELFAGSRSVGSEAEKQGFNVFSVDWENYEDIDLSIDIGKLTIEDVPFVPDAVWASPDCATYSIAGIRFHRVNTIEPTSDYAVKCDNVNMHFISLIKKWLEINPKLIFFIENPRGMLRKMPFMQEFKRHTVWYCKYGDNRAKPTDIWTNSKTWIPRPMCKNFKYNKETGEIVDKHCHHESAPRGAKTGTQGRKGSYNRSKIPRELCKEIIESILIK
jgi:site-specific DNA-cytosine methylase